MIPDVDHHSCHYQHHNLSSGKQQLTGIRKKRRLIHLVLFCRLIVQGRCDISRRASLGFILFIHFFPLVWKAFYGDNAQQKRRKMTPRSTVAHSTSGWAGCPAFLSPPSFGLNTGSEHLACLSHPWETPVARAHGLSGSNAGRCERHTLRSRFAFTKATDSGYGGSLLPAML